MRLTEARLQSVLGTLALGALLGLAYVAYVWAGLKNTQRWEQRCVERGGKIVERCSDGSAPYWECTR